MSHELDVRDAYLEIDYKHIKYLEGFRDFFLYTYNVEDNEFTSVIPLSSYYSGLGSSLITDPNYYLLWKMNVFAILDIKQEEEMIFSRDVNHMVLYDFNKFAALNDENQVDFFEISQDSLLYTLQHTRSDNFSLGRSVLYLVYQTKSFNNDGKIVLRDMESGSERIILEYEHHDL